MYVNAVNYRGLLSAADLAERINRPEEALRYRAVATGMKDAWVRAAAAQTANSGQPDPVRRMPTWLADAQTSGFFKSQLNGPNKARRRPQYLMSNNYFDLAEAHRQLFAGRVDLVWAPLERFWSRQESPGLYTWGENSGEESAYDRWEKVRRWTNRVTYYAPLHDRSRDAAIAVGHVGLRG